MQSNFYFQRNFYLSLIAISILFVLSYAYNPLFVYAKIILALYIICIIIEGYALHKASHQFELIREVTDKLYLGDIQNIRYKVTNNNNFKLKMELYDELPFQLQHRENITTTIIESKNTLILNHNVLPLERGLYSFGNSFLFIQNTKSNFLSYRKTFLNSQDIKVYPSVIQMQKYELQMFSKNAILSGVRNIRRIGESDEFEHIRPYLTGDNIKSINWKATSRQSQLKVNQYQVTKSQPVYCVIDKGRAMKMPFFGMTLLDHAINSALVLSNIILKKYDKVGLITFSDKMGSILKAQSLSGQLEKISQHLYNQKTAYKEPNFELLYYVMRQQISRRSVMLFYSNFEHLVDLNRHLPYLKMISRKHLLVVIIFINTEIQKVMHLECTKKSDIYLKTTAQTNIREKEEIIQKLHLNGIQAILTKPENLNINVINKYLEIKSKMMY